MINNSHNSNNNYHNYNYEREEQEQDEQEEREDIINLDKDDNHSDYSEDFENASFEDYHDISINENDYNYHYNEIFNDIDGDDEQDFNDYTTNNNDQNNNQQLTFGLFNGENPQTDLNYDKINSPPKSNNNNNNNDNNLSTPKINKQKINNNNTNNTNNSANNNNHDNIEDKSLLKIPTDLQDKLSIFDSPGRSIEINDNNNNNNSVTNSMSLQPGSKLWKKQLGELDHMLKKCMLNEQKRSAESSFITSTIAKNSRHSRALVEKQLSVALHQIQSYRKENEYIIQKLDTSIIHQELERQKQQIYEQDLKIKQLINENKGLQSVRRGHEKHFLEVEKEKEQQPEKDKSLHRDRILLEKKLKSLKNQIVNLQMRDRIQYQENRDLKQQNLKLKVKLQALEMSESVAISVRKHASDAIMIGGIGEDGMSMEVPSIHMIGDDSKIDSYINKESEIEYERLVSENSRLKSIVSNQRSSFRQQLTTLQSRLEKSLQKRKDLEIELEKREKEMKVQLLAVKELNRTCEELMKTNTKLREASSLYSRSARNPTQVSAQIPHLVPKPPATSRNTSPSRTRRTVILSAEDDLAPGGGNLTFLTSDQDND